MPKITDKIELPESVTDRIIESLIGFDKWLEENKRRFIEKYHA